MKRVFGLFLGILTAFGGFIDIGDRVADAQVGARFGLSLAFVTVAAVVIIMCFAEMPARIAIATRRAAFDVVRERLGPKAGLAGLAASFTVTAMLVMAELSGVALALELATSVNHLLFFAISLLGAQATPYETFFFSSGAVEQGCA